MPRKAKISPISVDPAGKAKANPADFGAPAPGKPLKTSASHSRMPAVRKRAMSAGLPKF